MRLRAAFAIGGAALVLAGSGSAASPRTWILYASDWSGPMEIYAADPTGNSPVRQVTFGRPSGTCVWAAACGFTDPLPSPDGRRLAYWSAVLPFGARPLWLANADGTGSQSLGTASSASWAPDSTRLAYSAVDGVHVRTAAGADRIVDHRQVNAVHYSPDGRALALDGAELIVLQQGREHVLTGSRPFRSAFAWMPGGRSLAYSTRTGIYLVPASGGASSLLYNFRAEDLSPIFPYPFELAIAPSGRVLAFTTYRGIRILDLRTHRARTVAGASRGLAWSPDGTHLLYVERRDSSDGDSITTGDVRAVTPDGRVQVLVSHSAPYAGQLVAAAWTTPPRSISYRAPAPVDGVFAGGPVQELAADGDHVGVIACGGVSSWTIGTGGVTPVDNPAECRAAYSRGHLYSLGIAGDRLVWDEKGWGLIFDWVTHEATLGSATIELSSGTGSLGSPPFEGIGTAVGSGSLLVVSSWKRDASGGGQVTEQTIERVEPGGCPCPAISSSPGPYTPLDVDASRIVVSGDLETRILAADGTVLLTLPVPTHAAQLSGSRLVIAVGAKLRVYDTDGVLEAEWPLPTQSMGHDCDPYGDPSCTRPPLTLGDVGRGLAAYSVDGAVHVLRLADGADRVIGPGTWPRFSDGGLVFADGARIRLVPFSSLPLT